MNHGKWSSKPFNCHGLVMGQWYMEDKQTDGHKKKEKKEKDFTHGNMSYIYQPLYKHAVMRHSGLPNLENNTWTIQRASVFGCNFFLLLTTHH